MVPIVPPPASSVLHPALEPEAQAWHIPVLLSLAAAPQTFLQLAPHSACPATSCPVPPGLRAVLHHLLCPGTAILLDVLLPFAPIKP